MVKFEAAIFLTFCVFFLQVGDSRGASPGEPRIVGGSTASQGQFPYQVSLQAVKKGEFHHFCGGSIASETWVVTAAHCVDTMQPSSSFKLQVVAGKHNIRVHENSEQRRDVSFYDVIIHENFSRSSKQNDIALLRLSQPLTFNTYVRPISLDTSGPQTGAHCIVSGWGRTNSGNNPPIMPQYLQYTIVPTIDIATCQGVKGIYSFIGQNKVCTGPLQGGRSTCAGDSGGPLVCNGRLSGIVSYGIKPCGYPNSPSVFTRVSSYRSWIKRYTGRSIPL